MFWCVDLENIYQLFLLGLSEEWGYLEQKPWWDVGVVDWISYFFIGFFFFFIWKTGGQVMFPQTWASGSHLVISLKMRQLSELLPEKQWVVFIANDTIWIFKQKLEFGRKCQGQKSLVGYRPWDGKELEATGRLSTHTSCQEADRFPAQPLLMRSAVMLTNVIFLFRMLFNEMVPR